MNYGLNYVSYVFKNRKSMDFLPPKIAQYAEAHTTPDTPVLANLDRQTHLKTLKPRMLSGHLQGRFLSMVSHMARPKAILEIGTFTGYSALCLAEGLAPGGMLHTIEADEELEPIIRDHIQASGFQDRICLHIGNALRIIPLLEGPFDIVFIDAAKREYPAYYDAIFPKVRPGGFIIADNILWLSLIHI